MKSLRKVVLAGIAACAMLGALSAFADSGAPWTVELDGSWRSGAVSDGESSSKEVYVVGPCTAVFQWKVSSYNSSFYCTVDADYYSERWVESIDWENVVLDIGEGEHAIRWTYWNYGSEPDYGCVSGFAYGEACSIALEANGGLLTGGNSVVRVSGSPIGEPDALPVPSKLDYEFDGWYTDAEGGEAVTADIIAANGLKFYAHWKPATFNWYYEETSDGTLTLTGVDTAASAFTIPSEIGGKKVTAIGDDAFEDSYELTEVVIPSSVKKIGEYAFGWCYNLASVTFEGDVSQIDMHPYAFAYTPWEAARPFEMIVDENGVVYGYHGTCPAALTADYWPEGVTAIDNYAFEDSYALTEIVIPASVKAIGEYSFGWCYNLATVTFEGDVSQIDINRYAFANTPWEAARPFTMIVDENGVVHGYHGTCPATLTADDWPEGVTAIGDYAFQNCYKLTNVEFPATVTAIGKLAFNYCINLASVTLNEGLDSIDESAFNGCNALVDVVVPATVRFINDYAFAYCSNLQSVALPETLKDVPVRPLNTFAGTPAQITYYPVNTVTVVWNANGGTFQDDVQAYTTNVVVGAYVQFHKPSPAPVRDGMYVAGWFTDPEGSGERVTKDMIAREGEDMAFFAFWQPLPFDATSENVPWTVDEDGTCRSYAFKPQFAAKYVQRFDPVNAESAMDKFVVGPAAVSFKMRTCDNNNGESLHFVVDGDYEGEVLVAQYNSDWTNVTFRIEDNAEHVLRWIYRRSPSGMWYGYGEVADMFVRTTSVLTFDAGEGVLAEGERTREVRIGAAVGELSVPTCEGYTFLGWFDADGVPVTADTVMGFDDVTVTARWENASDTPESATVNVVVGEGVDGFVMPPNVVLVAGEAIGEANYANLVNAIEEAAAPRHGRRLAGLLDGAGYANASTTVRNGMSLVAAWESFNPLYEDDKDAVETTAAQTYDGYILDKNGNSVGTIQVKVGKPGKKDGLAKVSATVQLIGTKKKLTFKAEENGKAAILATGATYGVVLVAQDYAPITVDIAENGLTGVWGDYEINGARNVSKKKTAEAAAYADWIRTVNVAFKTVSATGEGAGFAWGRSTVSVAIGSKGKVKITGTMADGSKVNASAQLLIAESGAEACVNVSIPLYTKKGGFGFVLWLAKDGTATVESVSAWDAKSKTPFVATLKPLAAGAIGAADGKLAFALVDAPAEIAGALVVAAATDGTSLLPDGVEATVAGGKVSVAKGGKVSLGKDGTITVTGTNAAGLKLTCTAKTGALKGSFSFYVKSGAKVKKVSVTLAGAIVGGKGYGTATIKKVGSFGFELR